VRRVPSGTFFLALQYLQHAWDKTFERITSLERTTHMAPSKKTVEQMVQLPSNDIGYACFRIIGETPLLVNCFNQKSFEQMLARMTG